MSETENANADQDPLLTQAGAASLRMMAGVVPAEVVQQLQQRLYAQPDEYPWQEVVDAVIAEPVDPAELLNKGLAGHRDWLLKKGAATPQAVRAVPVAGPRGGPKRKSMKVRGKTVLAALIVKGAFFVFYTLAVIGLLVLLRHKFPWFDIYRVLDWLREALPGVFGSG